jgi:tetratricopeptide (TPR) repeat protein
MKALGITALALVGGFILLLLVFGDWEESSLQSEAEFSVKQQLIDPSSAQFEKPVVNKSARTVCGVVNAKNRLGGYTGKQLYVYTAGGGATVIKDDAMLKIYQDQISRCGPKLATAMRGLETPPAQSASSGAPFAAARSQSHPVKSPDTPTPPPSAYARGLAALNDGNFDAAIAEFTAAIANDPKDTFSYIRRGTAYEKNGDAASAISDYRIVLKLVDAATGADYAAKIRKLEKSKK